VTWSVVRFGG